MKIENNNEVMTFQFHESENEVRSLVINSEPYFVGNDVAKALGYIRPKDAIRQHCKGAVKHRLLTKGGSQEMSVIPESDLFRLIIHSELPSAQKFERWVMEEVLPSIRKTGSYKMKSSQKDDFIDMRMIGHRIAQFGTVMVRIVDYLEQEWYSMNDLNKKMNTSTSSHSQAKSIGHHAQKFWLRGNTHPAWFCNKKGIELLATGNRTMKQPIVSDNQLSMF